MNKFVKAASLTLALAVSSAWSFSASAAQKIGYINTVEIFQSLPQREQVSQKLKAEFKDREGEIKSIEATAKKKIEQLNRDKELLTEEQSQKLQIEIGQLDSEYKIKVKSFEAAYKKRENEERQKLFVLIQGAVKDVAEKEGFDIVVDIQTLHFGKDAYDLSDEVVAALK